MKTQITILKKLLLLLFTILSINAISQTNYTWNGSVSSVWTNNNNWTPSTGFPTSIDNVTIVGGTTFDLILDADRTINNFVLTSGDFDLDGFELTVDGPTVTFTSGAIFNGSVEITGATTLTFGTGSPTISVSLTASTVGLTMSNTTFNNPINITRTGTGNANLAGNNVFNDLVTFRLTSTGNIRLSTTTRDIFNADVTFINTSTGTISIARGDAVNPTLFNEDIYFESSTGGTIETGAAGGSVTLANTKRIFTSGGFSVGTLTLRNLTQVGTTAQNITLTGTTSTLILGPGNTFNGDVTISSPRVQLNGNTFNEDVQITKTGNTADASTGNNTYNGNLILTNIGTGALTMYGAGSDVYSENITINSTGGGFVFGSAAGTGTLANGKTIIVGGGGFSSGALTLRNFTQTGTTTQNITLTGTSTITIGPGSTFNADVNFSSPGVLLNGCVYNGNVVIVKTGNGANASTGGNTYNGTLELTNNGTGAITLYAAGSDIYNENVLLNSSAGGFIFGTTAAGTGTLANGKTLSVGSGGYTAGVLTIRDFTQVGNTAQTINISASTGAFTLGPNNTFNGNIDFSGHSLLLNGNTFNGTATVRKTGNVANNSIGNNTYNGDLTVINTSNNAFVMYTSGSDIYNENIFVNSSGTNGITFGTAAVGTGTLANGKTISVGGGGFTSGNLTLRDFTQVGTTAQNITIGGTTSILILGPGSTFNADLTCSSPRIQLNGNTFNGNVDITKTGNSADASIGNNTYNGTLNLTSDGTGALTMYAAGSDIYNEDITINSTGGGFIFGSGAGTGSLAAGKTINIGGGGFSSGALTLSNFTQTTPLNITLTGTSTITLGPNSVFDAEVEITSPGILLNGAIYNSEATFTKNGTSTNTAGNGGNIFNENVTIIHEGAGGNFRFGGATEDDEYLKDVIFQNTGTGTLQPAYNGNSYFYGNISMVGSTRIVTFGASNGRVHIVGTDATVISGEEDFPPNFRRLTVDKANSITLQVPIRISSNNNDGDLDLQNGIINTSSTNLLIIGDETVTVNLGSANSHINGPMGYNMSLNGSANLTFPIGKSGDYSPIVVSPTHDNGTAYIYIAEVINGNSKYLGYQRPPSINRTSGVHYWNVSRNNAALTSETNANHTNSTITLYYKENDSVPDPDFLTVVKNNEISPTEWTDLSGTAVGTPTGQITSGAFTTYSTFTFGNLSAGINPLPVTLSHLSASCINESVVINWTTTSEINNSHFVIDRSEDGVVWQNIGQVEGAGNSVQEISYTFEDNFPLNGATVYRITQIDHDGQFETFKPLMVICSSMDNVLNDVSLYPNPNNGILEISGFTEGSTVIIYNSLGSKVYTSTLSANYTSINLENLPNGTYSVLVSNGSSSKLERLILIR